MDQKLPLFHPLDGAKFRKNNVFIKKIPNKINKAEYGVLKRLIQHLKLKENKFA